MRSILALFVVFFLAGAVKAQPGKVILNFAHPL